jgi:hypothetical protein
MRAVLAAGVTDPGYNLSIFPICLFAKGIVPTDHFGVTEHVDGLR